MAAPRPIVDALECVVSLFLSNVRHSLRAAFIMCDELVEMTCRECIKQTKPKIGRRDFIQYLQDPLIGLPPVPNSLGKRLLDSHTTRNDMQHSNPAATVDLQHCADAILDAVQAIEHCFSGATKDFPDTLTISLRIARLFATGADAVCRASFIQAMQRYHWRPKEQKPPKINEVVIAPGEQINWNLALALDPLMVDNMLDQMGAM